MKFIALLVLSVSLTIAVVGAASAYSPRLSLSDERLIGLTLAAPAGADGRKPIADSGAALTAEVLASLRAAGVKAVRVEEFSFGRWPGRWLFIVGVVGLIGGGLWVKSITRTALAAAKLAGADAGSPEELLGRIEREATRLHEKIGSAPDDEAVREDILEIVGELQRTDMPAFVDAARSVLTARGGIRLYATVIERFATGERRLNRAWSAAADGYIEEARRCVEEALPPLAESRERMGESAARA